MLPWEAEGFLCPQEPTQPWHPSHLGPMHMAEQKKQAETTPFPPQEQQPGWIFYFHKVCSPSSHPRPLIVLGSAW